MLSKRQDSAEKAQSGQFGQQGAAPISSQPWSKGSVNKNGSFGQSLSSANYFNVPYTVFVGKFSVLLNNYLSQLSNSKTNAKTNSSEISKTNGSETDSDLNISLYTPDLVDFVGNLVKTYEEYKKNREKQFSQGKIDALPNSQKFLQDLLNQTQFLIKKNQKTGQTTDVSSKDSGLKPDESDSLESQKEKSQKINVEEKAVSQPINKQSTNNLEALLNSAFRIVQIRLQGEEKRKQKEEEKKQLEKKQQQVENKKRQESDENLKNREDNFNQQSKSNQDQILPEKLEEPAEVTSEKRDLPKTITAKNSNSQYYRRLAKEKGQAQQSEEQKQAEQFKKKQSESVQGIGKEKEGFVKLGPIPQEVQTTSATITARTINEEQSNSNSSTNSNYSKNLKQASFFQSSLQSKTEGTQQPKAEKESAFVSNLQKTNEKNQSVFNKNLQETKYRFPSRLVQQQNEKPKNEKSTVKQEGKLGETSAAKTAKVIPWGSKAGSSVSSWGSKAGQTVQEISKSDLGINNNLGNRNIALNHNGVFNNDKPFLKNAKPSKIAGISSTDTGSVKTNVNPVKSTTENKQEVQAQINKQQDIDSLDNSDTEVHGLKVDNQKNNFPSFSVQSITEKKTNVDDKVVDTSGRLLYGNFRSSLPFVSEQLWSSLEALSLVGRDLVPKALVLERLLILLQTTLAGQDYHTSVQASNFTSLEPSYFFGGPRSVYLAILNKLNEPQVLNFLSRVSLQDGQIRYQFQLALQNFLRDAQVQELLQALVFCTYFQGQEIYIVDSLEQINRSPYTELFLTLTRLILDKNSPTRYPLPADLAANRFAYILEKLNKELETFARKHKDDLKVGDEPFLVNLARDYALYLVNKAGAWWYLNSKDLKITLDNEALGNPAIYYLNFPRQPQEVGIGSPLEEQLIARVQDFVIEKIEELLIQIKKEPQKQTDAQTAFVGIATAALGAHLANQIERDGQNFENAKERKFQKVEPYLREEEKETDSQYLPLKEEEKTRTSTYFNNQEFIQHSYGHIQSVASRLANWQVSAGYLTNSISSYLSLPSNQSHLLNQIFASPQESASTAVQILGKLLANPQSSLRYRLAGVLSGNLNAKLFALAFADPKVQAELTRAVLENVLASDAAGQPLNPLGKIALESQALIVDSNGQLQINPQQKEEVLKQVNNIAESFKNLFTKEVTEPTVNFVQKTLTVEQILTQNFGANPKQVQKILVGLAESADANPSSDDVTSVGQKDLFEVLQAALDLENEQFEEGDISKEKETNQANLAKLEQTKSQITPSYKQRKIDGKDAANIDRQNASSKQVEPETVGKKIIPKALEQPNQLAHKEGQNLEQGNFEQEILTENKKIKSLQEEQEEIAKANLPQKGEEDSVVLGKGEQNTENAQNAQTKKETEEEDSNIRHSEPLESLESEAGNSDYKQEQQDSGQEINLKEPIPIGRNQFTLAEQGNFLGESSQEKFNARGKFNARLKANLSETPKKEQKKEQKAQEPKTQEPKGALSSELLSLQELKNLKAEKQKELDKLKTASEDKNKGSGIIEPQDLDSEEGYNFVADWKPDEEDKKETKQEDLGNDQQSRIDKSVSFNQIDDSVDTTPTETVSSEVGFSLGNLGKLANNFGNYLGNYLGGNQITEKNPVEATKDLVSQKAKELLAKVGSQIVSAVLSALAPLWPIIAGLLIGLIFIVIIFAGITTIIVIPCKASNLLPKNVASIIYKAIPICKPSNCVEDQGDGIGYLGNGKVDSGVGVGNVPCLAAPRSGDLANPELRAFMRALGQAESGGSYTITNPYGCYGRYQFCPGGSWGYVQGKSDGMGGTFPADPRNSTPAQQDVAKIMAWNAEAEFRAPGFDIKTLIRILQSQGIEAALARANQGKPATAGGVTRYGMCGGWTPLCSSSVDPAQSQQDLIIRVYKQVLPEEKSGSCGQGSGNTTAGTNNNSTRNDARVGFFNYPNPFDNLLVYAQNNQNNQSANTASGRTNIRAERERLAKLFQEGKISSQDPEDIPNTLNGGFKDNLVLLMLKLYDSGITFRTGTNNGPRRGYGGHGAGESMDFIAFYKGKDYRQGSEPSTIKFVDKVNSDPQAFALVKEAIQIMKSTGVLIESQLIGPASMKAQGIVAMSDSAHEDHIHIQVDSSKPFNSSGVIIGGSGSDNLLGGSSNDCLCPSGYTLNRASRNTNSNNNSGSSDINLAGRVTPVQNSEITPTLAFTPNCPQLAALMRAISISESGGNYYVRYPGVAFTGDRHPGIKTCVAPGRNVPAGEDPNSPVHCIGSTAAGRYQFIAATFIDTVHKANLAPSECRPLVEKALKAKGTSNLDPDIKAALECLPYDPVFQDKVMLAHLQRLGFGQICQMNDFEEIYNKVVELNKKGDGMGNSAIWTSLPGGGEENAKTAAFKENFRKLIQEEKARNRVAYQHYLNYLANLDKRPHPKEFFAKLWGGVQAYAQQSLIKEEVINYKGVDGANVNGTLFLPEGWDKSKGNPIILGHDGFMGDGSGIDYYKANLSLGREMAERNKVPVFVMNYESGVGNGRSKSQVFSTDITDTIQAMNVLETKLGANNFTLAGGSRDSGVSFLAASRDARVDRVVIAYPVAKISNWKLDSEVYDTNREELRSGKYDLTNNSPKNPNAKIVVFQGTKDQVLLAGNPNAIEDVREFTRKVKAEYREYNGEDHGFIRLKPISSNASSSNASINSNASSSNASSARQDFMDYATGKQQTSSYSNAESSGNDDTCVPDNSNGASAGAVGQNVDPQFVQAMKAVERERDDKAYAGTCYASVWAGLTKNFVQNPNSPWAKLYLDLDPATARNPSSAIDFVRAVEEVNAKNLVLGKPTIKNLMTTGQIKGPDDVPAGAIVVVAPSYFKSGLAAIHGDINVKSDDGNFINYGVMNFMKDPQLWANAQKYIAGVYVPN